MSEVLSLTVASADGGEHRHDLEGTGHLVVECRDDPALPGHCVLRFTRPSTPAPLGCQPLPASQAQAAKALVHLLATGRLRADPSALALQPGECGRLTFGGARASLGSGHLHLLVERYCGTVGARFGARLRAWLPALAGRSATVDREGKLHNLLRASADDPVMRDLQDSLFDELYWDPSLRAASRLGIRSPLGVAVVHESWLRGAWTPLRDRASAGGSVQQVGEHEWLRRYVQLRRDWLATHPNPLLREAVACMDTFRHLMDQEAWALPLPLVVNGEEISPATLAAPPHGCHEGPEPGTRELAVHSPLQRGLDVRLVQLALSDQGCELRADGVWGPVTARCIRAFQRASELPETGIADAALIQKLLALEN
ncbi:peptidoglycan-binding protein [Ramlibacter sp. AN1133]|uniref:peptidoglycan-binding protein n=1 Tax=Ramlibacter sp. AN1133 TaxID=3133429 RepID=UPI0030BDD53F